ncbi:CpsD/CapB family tyrosine-protein kinase [Shimia haliotis]|uniref:Chromosome partitioning ATPase, Mrp family, contains Fe-S cluster n=1 Tax=Shimia haliotis TaxID=1280847 RepID=A0A1I4GGF7_9RHOB|nr:CpsD/CapB family tyrosine-protein kinase [Shimia haliotis]SFL28600.1 Chromosome partitioning ATPase, Mrp family, contains Fe-S cluster [Shimia haliotis]
MNDEQKKHLDDLSPAPEGNLPAVHDPDVFWDSLAVAVPDDAQLKAAKVVSATRAHPAHAAFDMLRTRMLQALSDNGWSRVAVAAPTRGCGSSFVTLNLAYAAARLSNTRTVVMDMDLRKPHLADMLNIEAPEDMAAYLSGEIAPEDFLIATRPNLAFGLSTSPADNSAEMFQATMTGDVLDELSDLLSPDLVLFDMPPALEFDDVLAFLPNVDAVLIVAGGGVSSAEDITKVEQILSEVKPILGVMLNNADGPVSY